MFAEPVPATQPIQAQAINALRGVMQREERFVKVHAAEALIELGLPQGVHDVFIEQEKVHRETTMYRLGVWRTLARCTSGTPEHDRWVGNLRKAAMDSAAPDQIGAIESLAKLKYAISADEQPAIEAAAASKDEGLAVFSLWLLQQAPNSENPQDRVARYLDSQDANTRLRTIYILRFLPNLSEANRAKIKAVARSEAKDTPTRAYATSSSFIVANVYGDAEEAQRAHGELLRILKTGKPIEKKEACWALGEQGSTEDLTFITPLLNDPEAPTRVGAGLAVARLTRPAKPSGRAMPQLRLELRPAAAELSKR